MVRKYEVGDVVEVIGVNEGSKRKSAITWVEEMDVYIGKTMTVCEVLKSGDFECYQLLGTKHPYGFISEWLKPRNPGVNDAPKCESVELW